MTQSIYPVGRVVKPHGVRGEVGIKLSSPTAEWLTQIKRLYLNGPLHQNLDLEIETARRFRDGLIVKFAGFNSRDEATDLRGHSVGIAVTDLKWPGSDGFYLYELNAFCVSNYGEKLGHVVDFGFNGVQDLIVTRLIASELLLEIPLCRPFLDRIDFAEQCIFFELPPDYLELAYKP